MEERVGDEDDDVRGEHGGCDGHDERRIFLWDYYKLPIPSTWAYSSGWHRGRVPLMLHLLLFLSEVMEVSEPKAMLQPEN